MAIYILETSISFTQTCDERPIFKVVWNVLHVMIQIPINTNLRS